MTKMVRWCLCINFPDFTIFSDFVMTKVNKIQIFLKKQSSIFCQRLFAKNSKYDIFALFSNSVSFFIIICLNLNFLYKSSSFASSWESPSSHLCTWEFFPRKRGRGPPKFFHRPHTLGPELNHENWFFELFQAWRGWRKYAGVMDNTQPSTFDSTNEVFQLSIWCFWRLYENGKFVSRCRFCFYILGGLEPPSNVRHMGGSPEYKFKRESNVCLLCLLQLQKSLVYSLRRILVI